jgi:hypothetical protein
MSRKTNLNSLFGISFVVTEKAGKNSHTKAQRAETISIPFLGFLLLKHVRQRLVMMG